MAKTRWYPMARTPRTWILSNGDTVIEPTFEETEAKRKARSVEPEPVSGSTKDVDKLAFLSVKREATRRDSLILCEALPVGNKTWRAGRGPFSVDLHPYRAGRVAFVAWWLYRHPTLPLEMLTTLGLDGNLFAEPDSYSAIVSVSKGLAVSRTLFPTVKTHYRQDKFDEKGLPIPPSPGESDTVNSIRAVAEVAQLVGKSPSLTNPEPSDFQRDPKGALRAWLAAAQQIGQEEMAFPSGNPATPVIKLDLVETNMDDDARHAVSNLIVNDELASEVLVAYMELRRVISKSGLVLAEARKSDFFKMLSGGEGVLARIRGSVLSPASTYDREVELLSPDRDHEVHLDIASGKVYVDCQREIIQDSRLEIVESWDRAQAVASITGTTDHFNEHARTYAQAKAASLIELAKSHDRRPTF